ncbi:hypothetical protein GCM10009854_39370 [Saccharopolyspora halophila]|uniref:Uncharacterized protein n=1 Tax=Saccharopolyspora halophila TaxID=405551 RepID=A0ABN3GP39_9PSEU
MAAGAGAAEKAVDWKPTRPAAASREASRICTDLVVIRFMAETLASFTERAEELAGTRRNPLSSCGNFGCPEV